MSTSHCKIIEEGKANMTGVLVIEPPSYQSDPIIFNKQNNKKPWTTRYSKQRFHCDLCVHNGFKNSASLSGHFKAKHIPKTLRQLAFKSVKQYHPKTIIPKIDRNGPHRAAVKKHKQAQDLNTKRIICHLCKRKFSGERDLIMHIKTKHTPKTLLTLSLKRLKLLMNTTGKQLNPPKSFINPTGLPVSCVSGTMSTTQNSEAAQIFRAAFASIQRKRQVIEVPTKDFQQGPVSKSVGWNINFEKSSTKKYSTESLHAPMEEDIKLGNSWSTKNNKNNSATIIRAVRYEPSERCRYFKEDLENHLGIEQNRNTDMQIIPEPSTASNQGVEAVDVKIPPECNTGIKREIDENNSNDNTVAHLAISSGVNIFAPMPNKMCNEGNSKTSSDEPSMKPLSNDYHSMLPTLNFSVGCNICNKYFKNDYVLLNHMKFCHVEYRCEWCGYMFGSRFLLTQHLASIHNIKIKNDKGKYRRSNIAFNSNRGYQRSNVASNSNRGYQRSNVASNSNRGYQRSNVASNSNRGYRWSNVAFNSKAQRTFPNVKYEPALPNVKFEPAFPNVKVEPASSNVKVEPILIKVEPNIEPNI